MTITVTTRMLPATTTEEAKHHLGSLTAHLTLWNLLRWARDDDLLCRQRRCTVVALRVRGQALPVDDVENLSQHSLEGILHIGSI